VTKTPFYAPYSWTGHSLDQRPSGAALESVPTAGRMESLPSGSDELSEVRMARLKAGDLPLS
jgi:hypothetical protein